MEECDGLWNSVRDVEEQHGGRDNRVKSRRRGKEKQAVAAAEDDGGDGGSDWEAESWIDMGEVVREWHATLDGLLVCGQAEVAGKALQRKECSHRVRRPKQYVPRTPIVMAARLGCESVKVPVGLTETYECRWLPTK